MVADSISLERPLFQFVTAFSGINVGRVVWEQYQQFAIPKIENSTKELANITPGISALTPSEAAELLKTIQSVIPKVDGVRKMIEPENGEDFRQFKSVALSFFNQLDYAVIELTKAANQSDNVRAVFHHMVINRKNPAITKHLK